MILMGPMVLQFTPPETASLEENVATFLQPGDASLHVQVGVFEQDLEVTVAE
jgi:hypothetical protein